MLHLAIEFYSGFFLLKTLRDSCGLMVHFKSRQRQKKKKKASKEYICIKNYNFIYVTCQKRYNHNSSTVAGGSPVIV